ncbi:alpha/beta hydrolase [Arthrobacter crusticola]
MNCTADLWSGCGLEGSIMPSLDEPTIDGQVQALLDTLPPRFALGGLSLGGIVGMALCRRAPERVTRLCLISTNAKAPTEMQRKGWRIWRDRLASGATPADLQHEILDALLGYSGRPPAAQLAQRVLRMGSDTGEERLDAQLRMQASRVDQLSSLRDLKTPLLVISGTADTICPPQYHREITAAVPMSCLAAVKTGHLAPMQRSEEVGWLVKSWLGS